MLQRIVKKRWDFLSTELTGISYMLVPKFALDGFYVDNDQLDILNHVKIYALRCQPDRPEIAENAMSEMIRYAAKVSSLTGSHKQTVMAMDGDCYWNIQGRREFPNLYAIIKGVNKMICSSAASERIWSLYRFIHSRLRNRLSNEKIEKLMFVYVNCAILDKADQTNYFEDLGATLSGIDYEDY
jgi:hypothetical protein